jgi:hypothetical protein
MASTGMSYSCVACGKEGQACCDGSTCSDDTMVCKTGGFGAASTCTACGGTGEPCCSGNTCRTGTCRMGNCS